MLMSRDEQGDGRHGGVVMGWLFQEQTHSSSLCSCVFVLAPHFCPTWFGGAAAGQGQGVFPVILSRCIACVSLLVEPVASLGSL